MKEKELTWIGGKEKEQVCGRGVCVVPSIGSFGN